jgi:ketosteroid isomerase-like protein
MSQENIEKARTAVRLWNDGRAEEVLEIIDPAVEIHTPFSSLAGTPYVGVEGYLRWLADIRQQFDLWELQVEDYRAVSDNCVFASGGVRVRGRGSGVELVQPSATIADFVDGRLRRLRIYLDEAEALSAAGLEE